MEIQEIARAIKKVGANERHFLAREVREGLGIDPTDRTLTSALHNGLRALTKDKVITEVPGGRRRNRYYRVADLGKLRSLSLPLGRLVAEGEGDGSIPPRASSDRLARIEQAIQNISDRLDQVDTKVGELSQLWQ